MPTLSVIVVNYNVRSFLENALTSITRALAGIDGEVIVAEILENKNPAWGYDAASGKFVDMFKGFEVALPLPTRILIAVGYLMTNPWYLIPVVLFFVAAFILFMRYKATPNGRRRVDGLGRRDSGL